MGREDLSTVEGNCVVCGARTNHAIRTDAAGSEYFECLRCGNKLDAKVFVFDNLDALEERGASKAQKRAGVRRRVTRRRPRAALG